MADGAALMAAAVRAAVLAKAPRRTVQAVAAAVAGALRPQPALRPRTSQTVPAGAPAESPPPRGSSPEELLEALREARRVQRRRKKERRRANRSAKTNGDQADGQALTAANLRHHETELDNACEHSGGGAQLALTSSPVVERPTKLHKTGENSGGQYSHLPRVPPFPSEAAAIEDDAMGKASEAGSLKTFSGRSRPPTSDMDSHASLAEATRCLAANSGGSKPRQAQEKLMMVAVVQGCPTCADRNAVLRARRRRTRGM